MKNGRPQTSEPRRSDFAALVTPRAIGYDETSPRRAKTLPLKTFPSLEPAVVHHSARRKRSRAAASPATKGTYAFVSLGCPKNLVDSERMLGLLQLDGYQLVSEPDGADFVVVNTCGFIERARQESFAAIHEMLELKRQGGHPGRDRLGLPGRAREGSAARDAARRSTTWSASSAASR